NVRCNFDVGTATFDVTPLRPDRSFRSRFIRLALCHSQANARAIRRLRESPRPYALHTARKLLRRHCSRAVGSEFSVHNGVERKAMTSPLVLLSGGFGRMPRPEHGTHDVCSRAYSSHRSYIDIDHHR